MTMNMPLKKVQFDNGLLFDFISNEILPANNISPDYFWTEFDKLVKLLVPLNQRLLETRVKLQSQIDEWHRNNRGRQFSPSNYKTFLTEIGYLQNETEDFCIDTQNVDKEISSIAGPQLVVPVNNARFAINAANARWGSLYDALYGTDAIFEKNAPPSKNTDKTDKQKTTELRKKAVIAYAKDFLDDIFPLDGGSHHQVNHYRIYYQHLLATFRDGSSCGLKTPAQFIAYNGSKNNPTSVLLRNNGLHLELQINRNGKIGNTDLAGIDDIQAEAALTCIMDFEDSVSAVDTEDKVEVYRHWLKLIKGELEVNFDKNGSSMTRRLNSDKFFIHKDGSEYQLPGRALLMARNVGLLMNTCDEKGKLIPEGILDAVVSALIGQYDINNKNLSQKNSKTDSIYIVKPKLHGPEEVNFTCVMFNAIEDMLNLKRHTIKLGIMDEERRTTLNLKACIKVARERVVFINTGFLDRTGDEIHTSMQAGPFLPKNELKHQPWLTAYEQWNVNTGLACGFKGKAQIGKGMWAMPDEMNKMLQQKIEHPLSGASTAWVPSPSAAVLHAIHYHKINVTEQQVKQLNQSHFNREKSLQDILTIPLLENRQELSVLDVERELENNIQSILGYVVRWIELGIGCSKVPDINHTALMEDRATLRISSQHIANWLHHGICNKQQVLKIMQRMASVVDLQNKHTNGYHPMTPDTSQSLAFNAAQNLIFSGDRQPNGYTEPLLHQYRMLAKYR